MYCVTYNMHNIIVHTYSAPVVQHKGYCGLEVGQERRPNGGCGLLLYDVPETGRLWI